MVGVDRSWGVRSCHVVRFDRLDGVPVRSIHPTGGFSRLRGMGYVLLRGEILEDRRLVLATSPRHYNGGAAALLQDSANIASQGFGPDANINTPPSSGYHTRPAVDVIPLWQGPRHGQTRMRNEYFVHLGNRESQGPLSPTARANRRCHPSFAQLSQDQALFQDPRETTCADSGARKFRSPNGWPSFDEGSLITVRSFKVAERGAFR